MSDTFLSTTRTVWKGMTSFQTPLIERKKEATEEFTFSIGYVWWLFLDEEAMYGLRNR